MNPVPMAKMTSRHCAYCGEEFISGDKRQRYCSRDCVSRYGRERLAELRARGQDPSHGGKAAQARRDSLAKRRASGELLGRAAAKAKREGQPVKPADPNLIATREDDEETAWAERGRYWEDSAGDTPVPASPKKKRRRAEPKPLVLNGHGVRLRIYQGALVVQNGFTHYPQERQEIRLFPGDQRLPSRIIVLDSDGSISLDVIKWLSRQRVPLVLLDWQGEIVSVLGDGTAYDPALREAQIAASTNGSGLRLATRLIQDKLLGSQVTLRTLRKTLAREVALSKLEAVLDELKDSPPASIEGLRMLEARGALAYFTCWQSLSLRWKGTGRKPIPSEWERVGLRQSLLNSRNRHASHPVNAMLNYAYGVLESQVRTATVASGLDPTIGYLHACRSGRAALVYDLMEPLRPQVDRLVLDLVRSHVFSPSDFILMDRGVCRLHPQLARQMARLTADDTVVQETISWLPGEMRAATNSHRFGYSAGVASGAASSPATRPAE